MNFNYCYNLSIYYYWLKSREKELLLPREGSNTESWLKTRV
jgi:hypothetical protein